MKDPIELDIEPLRNWVERKIGNGYETAEALALSCRVNSRTMWRIRHESETISLHLVDHMLTAEGSTHYSQLYPDP